MNKTGDDRHSHDLIDALDALRKSLEGLRGNLQSPVGPGGEPGAPRGFGGGVLPVGGRVAVEVDPFASVQQPGLELPRMVGREHDDRVLGEVFQGRQPHLAGLRAHVVGLVHQDGDEATIALHEKGDKHRRIGLHFAAAQAIAEYIEKADLTKGPLFRARRHSKKPELGARAIGSVTMYNLIQGYLTRLPGSMREEEVATEDGTVKKRRRCAYTPHSLRATTATLLLDAGVDIIKVKELLGHRHVTTTQIYDKRRRSLKEGASHDVPI
jgi:hypothetical protein